MARNSKVCPGKSAAVLLDMGSTLPPIGGCDFGCRQLSACLQEFRANYFHLGYGRSATTHHRAGHGQSSGTRPDRGLAGIPLPRDVQGRRGAGPGRCPPGPIPLAVVARSAPDGCGLIAGDEVSAGKPDPEPYLKGAALLGLEPGACVALEDSKPGLASAEAAGTIAIGIPHLVELEQRPGRNLWSSLQGRGVADLQELTSRLSV